MKIITICYNCVEGVRRMESVLNQLYRGEIHPEESYRPVMPGLLKMRKAFVEHQEALLSELDDQTRNKVRELLEERTLVSSYEIEDAYVQGMRLGAKMAAALLKDPNDEYKIVGKENCRRFLCYRL